MRQDEVVVVLLNHEHTTLEIGPFIFSFYWKPKVGYFMIDVCKKESLVRVSGSSSSARLSHQDDDIRSIELF